METYGATFQLLMWRLKVLDTKGPRRIEKNYTYPPITSFRLTFLTSEYIKKQTIHDRTIDIVINLSLALLH